MCEIGKKFSNIKYYNKEMQKGMEDKLFFLNKLPTKDKYVFVDFGCADGSMINALSSILEGKFNKYIGYDISETMIDLAKTNYHGPLDSYVVFTNQWNEVKKELDNSKIIPNMKSVLILSSVIHEVYSYAKDLSDIDDFWNKVLNSNFDYIVIRDMCPSEDIDRGSDVFIETKIREQSETKLLEEFEQVWGKISNKRNLIHFLLKYRWRVNWKRELHENYFPITTQILLGSFEKYNIDYFERFRVPFLDKCWKEDFDVEISDYTHIKAIFTKKK